MDQVEFLFIHRDVQMIRQPGEKTQDLMPIPGSAAVEQSAIGAHPAILTPQFPGPYFLMQVQGAQTHLLMVAQQHGDIVRCHDLLQKLHTMGASVDHIPQNI